MKIQASRISNTVPFAVEGVVSVDDANRFMRENEEEVVIDSPISYKGTLKHCKGGIRFEAAIEAALKQACVRCNALDEFALEISVNDLLVDVADSPKDDEIILGSDDLNVVFYDKGQIDVDHLVLESVWAELDSSHLCNDDCRGLCPMCGKNLNDGDCGCSKS